MGRKARLKAQRRKERKLRERLVADVCDHLNAIDGLITNMLSRCRERGVRGANVLQLLGVVLCCWAEGIEFDELRRRAAVDPSLDDRLGGWTKCALASLAGISRSAQAHDRENAAWALEEIGVDEDMLGPTWGAGRGKADGVVMAECAEGIDRIDEVVSAVWGAAGKPDFAGTLAGTSPEPRPMFP